MQALLKARSFVPKSRHYTRSFYLPVFQRTVVPPHKTMYTSTSDHIVVYVTAPTEEISDRLANGLVEKNLIACANVTPVKSTYRWEGKIQKDSEYLMILKTQKELLPEVNKFIKENHPYTVPEVIGLPIIGGSVDYLKWVTESTQKTNT